MTGAAGPRESPARSEDSTGGTIRPRLPTLESAARRNKTRRNLTHDNNVQRRLSNFGPDFFSDWNIMIRCAMISCDHCVPKFVMKPISIIFHTAYVLQNLPKGSENRNRSARLYGHAKHQKGTKYNMHLQLQVATLSRPKSGWPGPELIGIWRLLSIQPKFPVQTSCNNA